MVKRRRRMTWLWGLSFLVIVAIIIVTVIMLRNHSLEKEDTSYIDKQETTQIAQSSKEDKSSLNSDDIVEKENVSQYDGTDPNTAGELSGVISYAGADGGTLMIRVNIDQYLVDGKCSLKLAKGETTIYETSSGIVASVATSTCDGFNIPTSNLDSGEMELKIMLESNGKNGIITGKVEI